MIAGAGEGTHHVVLLGAGHEPMAEPVALAVARRILESPAPHLFVDVRDPDVRDDGAVASRLVDTLRDACRRDGRALGLSLFTSLDGMTSRACDWIVEGHFAISLGFDGPREVHDAHRGLTLAAPHEQSHAWVREIHARFDARGVPRELAYVTALVRVSRASRAAGPAAVLRACRDVGLQYIELQPLRAVGRGHDDVHGLACSSDEYLRFYREAIAQILASSESGTLLVEKRLAMHLETLASVDPRVARPTRVERLVFGADGRVYARESEEGSGVLGHVETHSYEALAERALDPAAAEPRSSGCVACRHDPYCGHPRIRDHTRDEDVVTKVYDSEWCRRSMGSFDFLFECLRSPEGLRLRAVTKRWMEARDRVAARRRAPGDGRG